MDEIERVVDRYVRGEYGVERLEIELDLVMQPWRVPALVDAGVHDRDAVRRAVIERCIQRGWVTLNDAHQALVEGVRVYGALV